MRRSYAPWRSPIHVGTRLFSDDPPTSAAQTHRVLATIPVLAGEYVSELELDLFGATTGQETNIDQPPVFGWGVTWHDIQFGDSYLGAIGTPGNPSFDKMFVEALQNDNQGVTFADANPSGEAAVPDAWLMQGPKVLMTKYNIGVPIPTGLDGLGNADARWMDKVVWQMPVRRRAKAGGVILVGAIHKSMAAQTDHALAEFDGSADLSDVARGYSSMTGAGLTGAAIKAHEIFHGGDTYIEADSFKSGARRTYAFVRARIQMNRRLMVRVQTA